MLHRGLAMDDISAVCGHAKEDTLHVLRDCVLAIKVWQLTPIFRVPFLALQRRSFGLKV